MKSQHELDLYFLNKTIQLAQKANDEDEVPVGALCVNSENKIIASAYNKKESTQSVTAHAEILTLLKANKKFNSWRLEGCTLYSSLEPCLMCAGAIIAARIKRVVYACEDIKGGAESCARIFSDVTTNHRVEVNFVKISKSEIILKEFFKKKRKIKK